MKFTKHYNLLKSFLAIMFVLRGTLQGLSKAFITTVEALAGLVLRALSATLLTAYIGYYGVALANPIARGGGCIILFSAYAYVMRRLYKKYKSKADPAA